MPERQLSMIRPDLEDLPEIDVPDGYGLRTYRPGDETAWCEIMNTGIGSGWTEERCIAELTNQDPFLPDGCVFVTKTDTGIATACAYDNGPEGVRAGQVHMVCAMPEHRGQGLGRIVTLAVLHYMWNHGFVSAFLGTDDFRLPAIKTYLGLGFVPDYLEDSHRKRWSHIFANIVRPVAHS